MFPCCISHYSDVTALDAISYYTACDALIIVCTRACYDGE